MNNSSHTNIALIKEFLGKLGFSEEEVKLYITLTQKGPLTLLEASRASGIERTKIYRMIDDLKEKKLLEEIPQYKRTVIKGAGLQTIELLVKEKELENKFLQNNAATFTHAVNVLTKSLPENNVIYYRGVEGIRQMTWNMLRCKGLFRTYSCSFWNDILGDSFVDELNKELLARHFSVHDLYSDQYIEFKNQWMKEKGGKPSGDWHFWHSRYISEKIVKINQNIDIYNNVVSYYYWQGEETFGVEIYNQRIADMQKQIHDVLWKMAKRRKELDWTIDWK